LDTILDVIAISAAASVLDLGPAPGEPFGSLDALHLAGCWKIAELIATCLFSMEAPRGPGNPPRPLLIVAIFVDVVGFFRWACKRPRR